MAEFVGRDFQKHPDKSGPTRAKTKAGAERPDKSGPTSAAASGFQVPRSNPTNRRAKVCASPGQRAET